MSYEAPTIYQTEQVRPNTTPEAQIPTISQETLDAIANIRNPQLLAQLTEGAPTRYLGSINTSTARQYCKQGNKSNSLVGIDSENEVVVCKKNPVGFG